MSMAEMTLGIPEELILRTFVHLHSIDDLFAVRRTCKQFHRISQDLGSSALLPMALRTPALYPAAQFMAVAAAPQLLEWLEMDSTSEKVDRRARLEHAMCSGINGLAEFISVVAPFNLNDIRDLLSWKRKVLLPVSKGLPLRARPPRGMAWTPTSWSTLWDTWNPDGLTSQGRELALWNLTLYGELFPISLSYHGDEFDNLCRLSFLVYCVPDEKCFSTMEIEPPDWFADYRGQGERRQQLELHELADIAGSRLACLLPPEPTFERLYGRVIWKAALHRSGRKAIDHLLSHVSEFGDRYQCECGLDRPDHLQRQDNPDPRFQWVRDLYVATMNGIQDVTQQEVVSGIAHGSGSMCSGLQMDLYFLRGYRLRVLTARFARGGSRLLCLRPWTNSPYLKLREDLISKLSVPEPG